MMTLQATWIWTVWVLPNICIIQPLTWYYYSTRFRRLGALLTQWNRSYDSRTLTQSINIKYHNLGITAPAKVCRSTWECQERCTTEGLPGEGYFIYHFYLN